MATRKIVSQTDDSTQAFPKLFPLSKVLEEDKTFEGVEYKAGQTDPEYKPEIETVFLISLNDRAYFSVHGNYTATMLKPTEENDYVIEKTLDGNFTNTVLKWNDQINDKYKEDASYLTWLGLPAYVAEQHTTDLFIEDSIDKEVVAQAEAKWLASEQEKIQWFAAQGVEITGEVQPSGKGDLTPPVIPTNAVNNTEEGA